jgi:hypothetical protein
VSKREILVKLGPFKELLGQLRVIVVVDADLLILEMDVVQGGIVCHLNSADVFQFTLPEVQVGQLAFGLRSENWIFIHLSSPELHNTLTALKWLRYFCLRCKYCSRGNFLHF